MGRRQHDILGRIGTLERGFELRNLMERSVGAVDGLPRSPTGFQAGGCERSEAHEPPEWVSGLTAARG